MQILLQRCIPRARCDLHTLDARPKPSSPSKQIYVPHHLAYSSSCVNAIKARMFVGRYMGDKTMLGGEFVFNVNNSNVRSSMSRRTVCSIPRRNSECAGRGGEVPPDTHVNVFAGCRTSPHPPQIQSEVIEASHSSCSALSLASNNSLSMLKERKRWADGKSWERQLCYRR